MVARNEQRRTQWPFHVRNPASQTPHRTTTVKTSITYHKSSSNLVVKIKNENMTSNIWVEYHRLQNGKHKRGKQLTLVPNAEHVEVIHLSDLNNSQFFLVSHRTLVGDIKTEVNYIPSRYLPKPKEFPKAGKTDAEPS